MLRNTIMQTAGAVHQAALYYKAAGGQGLSEQPTLWSEMFYLQLCFTMVGIHVYKWLENGSPKLILEGGRWGGGVMTTGINGLQNGFHQTRITINSLSSFLVPLHTKNTTQELHKYGVGSNWCNYIDRSTQMCVKETSKNDALLNIHVRRFMSLIIDFSTAIKGMTTLYHASKNQHLLPRHKNIFTYLTLK